MGPVVACLCVAQLAAPTERSILVISARQSTIGYEIKHPLHEIKGESKAVEGKLVTHPGGKTQVMVRLAVASLKSGDANRDVHMLEVVEGAQYPFVVLKAVLQHPAPVKSLAAVAFQVEAQIEFHGQKHKEPISLKLQRIDEHRLRVTGSFVISLDRYGVERPSLMFVELPDPTSIHVNLLWQEEE
jgi:polyisoprenoid-binding protein YceI